MELSRFSFSHSCNGEVAHFAFGGQLLLEDEKVRVMEELNQYLSSGVKKVTVDLAELKHANSIGLGLFIIMRTEVMDRSGQLTLRNPDKHLAYLFQVTKLDTVFTIEHGPAN